MKGASLGELPTFLTHNTVAEATFSDLDFDSVFFTALVPTDERGRTCGWGCLSAYLYRLTSEQNKTAPTTHLLKKYLFKKYRDT